MYAISNWKGDNMYEYIIGKVTFVSPYYIVVETNGIGYQISVDNPYRYSGKMDTDIKYLTKFPGVGKKTAQQMILDLKGKLGELESSEAAVAAMTATEAVTTSNQALAEALEALSALGYSDREIKRITKQLEALGETTTDVYLSNALKFMMKR